MRLNVISCEILYREVCRLVAVSPHTCDVEFLPKGLHDLGVDRMRPRIQERIDALCARPCDAVLLGYGLCNNGSAGLCARGVPLVIPRAHDCITLFMGGRDRYRAYFDAHPGTYYRTTGWYERNDSGSAGEITVPQKLGLFMRYEDLVEKYGEENAKYVMETMGDPTAHYDRVTFISMGLECEAPFRERARKEAAEKGWTFDEIRGSLVLLEKLLFGQWDDDFVVVPPGGTVKPSYDDAVLCAGCPAGAGAVPAAAGREGSLS